MNIPPLRVLVGTYEDQPIVRVFGTAGEIHGVLEWFEAKGMKVPSMHQMSNSTWWGRDYGFFYQPTTEQLALIEAYWSFAKPK